MFGFKNEIVSTEDYCKKINMIILAMEVFFGQCVSLKKFEFNFSIGVGEVYVGGRIEKIKIDFKADDSKSISFKTGCSDQWFCARFDKNSEVKIIREYNHDDYIESNNYTWLVGHSASERWNEPFVFK